MVAIPGVRSRVVEVRTVTSWPAWDRVLASAAADVAIPPTKGGKLVVMRRTRNWFAVLFAPCAYGLSRQWDHVANWAPSGLSARPSHQQVGSEENPGEHHRAVRE